jgi:hypothetical protein
VQQLLLQQQQQHGMAVKDSQTYVCRLDDWLLTSAHWAAYALDPQHYVGAEEMGDAFKYPYKREQVSIS